MRRRQPPAALSLLLFDMDRFKVINDLYGHLTGDQVLVQVGHAVRATLRLSDGASRWGGEEFLCLLPDTDAQQAMQIAERLRERIAATELDIKGHHIRTSISVGVANYPQDGHSTGTLLAAADANLYEAKRGGRNRVLRCSHESGGILSLAGQLEEALRENRVRAAYQPIIDLKNGRMQAEEALARLLGPEGETREAGCFIEAATQSQLLHLVDFTIIQQAMDRCVQGLARNERIIHFVNVSADLLRHPDLLKHLQDYAEGQCQACADQLGGEKPIVIELTERELLGDTRQVRRLLAPFLDFGLRLAIDDFGSGYSSFKYLSDLPVSFLKIEGEFVRGAEHEPKMRRIVQHIHDIAQDFNLITIAEQVENQVTVNIMQDIGIDWAQGYHFGRPLMQTN